MRDVAGKVAFIAGGSSGIGLGIARAFSDAGMKVVITYRTKAHLDEAMKCFTAVADRIHAIDLEVTDRDAMNKAAEKAICVYGKVHTLVNNAGVQNSTTLSRMSYEEWDRMMAGVPGSWARIFMSIVHGETEFAHVVGAYREAAWELVYQIGSAS